MRKTVLIVLGRPGLLWVAPFPGLLGKGDKHEAMNENKAKNTVFFHEHKAMNEPTHSVLAWFILQILSSLNDCTDLKL